MQDKNLNSLDSNVLGNFFEDFKQYWRKELNDPLLPPRFPKEMRHALADKEVIRMILSHKNKIENQIQFLDVIKALPHQYHACLVKEFINIKEIKWYSTQTKDVIFYYNLLREHHDCVIFEFVSMMKTIQYKWPVREFLLNKKGIIEETFHFLNNLEPSFSGQLLSHLHWTVELDFKSIEFLKSAVAYCKQKSPFASCHAMNFLKQIVLIYDKKNKADELDSIILQEFELFSMLKPKSQAAFLNNQLEKIDRQTLFGILKEKCCHSDETKSIFLNKISYQKARRLLLKFEVIVPTTQNNVLNLPLLINLIEQLENYHLLPCLLPYLKGEVDELFIKYHTEVQYIMPHLMNLSENLDLNDSGLASIIQLLKAYHFTSDACQSLIVAYKNRKLKKFCSSVLSSFRFKDLFISLKNFSAEEAELILNKLKIVDEIYSDLDSGTITCITSFLLGLLKNQHYGAFKKAITRLRNHYASKSPGMTYSAFRLNYESIPFLTELGKLQKQDAQYFQDCINILKTIRCDCYYNPSTLILILEFLPKQERLYYFENFSRSHLYEKELYKFLEFDEIARLIKICQKEKTALKNRVGASLKSTDNFSKNILKQFYGNHLQDLYKFGLSSEQLTDITNGNLFQFIQSLYNFIREGTREEKMLAYEWIISTFLLQTPFLNQSESVLKQVLLLMLNDDPKNWKILLDHPASLKISHETFIEVYLKLMELKAIFPKECINIEMLGNYHHISILSEPPQSPQVLQDNVLYLLKEKDERGYLEISTLYSPSLRGPKILTQYERKMLKKMINSVLKKNEGFNECLAFNQLPHSTLNLILSVCVERNEYQRWMSSLKQLVQTNDLTSPIIESLLGHSLRCGFIPICEKFYAQTFDAIFYLKKQLEYCCKQWSFFETSPFEGFKNYFFELFSPYRHEIRKPSFKETVVFMLVSLLSDKAFLLKKIKKFKLSIGLNDLFELSLAFNETQNLDDYLKSLNQIFELIKNREGKEFTFLSWSFEINKRNSWLIEFYSAMIEALKTIESESGTLESLVLTKIYHDFIAEKPELEAIAVIESNSFGTYGLL